MPKVAIVLGSSSDLEVFQDARKLLDAFDVEAPVFILSAHRSPKKTIALAGELTEKGIELVIAGAGGAAHLPGIIAAHTTVPVVGVPVAAPPLEGWDAMLSILQMPKGVPVATMAVGKAGAINAAIFAAQVLAFRYSYLEEKLARLKAKMEETVAFKLSQIISGL